MTLSYISLIFFSLITVTLCAHFRGSMITWRVVNSTNTSLAVEVRQRHVWNYVTYPCTNAQILAGNYMIGSGNLVCTASCPPNMTTLGSVIVPCTGFNQIEQYVSGESRFQVRIPPNYIFQAVFTSSAWFALVTGGGTWSVATQINTYKRSNGRYNQAPIVTMLPIIRLRQNFTYYTKINVADNDFDRYTCLWSNTTQECGGVCRSLLTLPASTYLNETSCVLRFTPVTVGFYAMALTIVDFENDSSTVPLSRVPIQFIFNVWKSNITCATPPIYLGDAPADQCIFVEPGQILTTLIRIQIQCPGATLANVIAVYPIGFSQSSTYTDPYDSTVNIFQVSYTATTDQVGQNLFCFAAVDSIGNQADSTCLRFTVQILTDSQNILYLNNATHFPSGLVSKYQSTWTLIYPAGLTYSRPSISAYIRFKITSTQQDYVTYDVAKQTNNVNYQSDRLVIISNVVFVEGTQFFISLDPGVFLPIATCLRDSMGISDASFWPFQTAHEPNSTVTTSTTTQSSTTTMLNRTVPTVRTIPTTIATLITEKTTILSTTITNQLTTIKGITVSSPFPVSAIVAIIVGGLILLGITFLITRVVRCRRLNSSTESSGNTKQLSPLSEISHQYLITTRANTAATSGSNSYSTHTSVTSPALILDNLVEIEQ